MESENETRKELLQHCNNSNNNQEVSMDWKGRPSNPDKHGGARAAVCILGLQISDVIATNAVGTNLIMYLSNQMHFPLSKAANTVTNFMGTQCLLSLLGGFIADTYLGSLWTMVLFTTVQLLGYIVLGIQAHVPQLRPPKCNKSDFREQPNTSCVEASGFQSFILYTALYLVAIGSGCIKPNIASYGADQFKNGDGHKQSKKISSYFNAGYFTCCMATFFVATFVVWIETYVGMDVGFMIASVVITLGLISLSSGITRYRNSPPAGNIFLTISKVCVAAVINRENQSEDNAEKGRISSYIVNRKLSKKFKFLDKACFQGEERTKEGSWRLCTVIQVEQVKIIISAIPIFACTVFFNTILAQLQTFSVHQGKQMNIHVTKSFQIPPASLQAIPSFMLLILIPLYEVAFVPFARKLTKIDSGITMLQRVGVGLFVATFSMVAAALSESKRKKASVESGEILSIFWIVPQFLICGLSEMFTSVGLIEFFYKQSLGRMQSFLTAVSYCTYSIGFYLSSVLVVIVNKMSTNSRSAGGGWLNHDNLDEDKLDLFYWLLAALSFINFLNFLYWSNWYKPSPSATTTTTTTTTSSELDDPCADDDDHSLSEHYYSAPNNAIP